MARDHRAEQHRRGPGFAAMLRQGAIAIAAVPWPSPVDEGQILSAPPTADLPSEISGGCTHGVHDVIHRCAQNC